MRKILIVLAGLFLSAPLASAKTNGDKATAHIIVYKTKAKYKNLVPVQLSTDRKTVVSFPARTDVQPTGSGFPLPIALHVGYWMDRIGVGPNTAYIKLTYTQYRDLKNDLSAAELNKLIIDRSPITEICDCGVKNTKNSVSRLNALIDKKQLKKKCRKVK